MLALGSVAQVARSVLAARVPTRIVWERASDLPVDPEGLRDEAGALTWEEWLPPRSTWSIRGSGHTPDLRHTRFLEQVVRDAVRDRFDRLRRTPPPFDPRAPRVLIDARVGPQGASLGLDLAAASLHRRGTARRGEAPLREDVAAGLAYLAGAPDATLIVDPFCGTGTLAIEAAAVALGIPAGREASETALPLLDTFAALDFADLARERLTTDETREVDVLASDSSREATDEARRAIAIVGLAGAIRVSCQSISERTFPSRTGLVLSNPPWGVRLDPEAARAAWYAMGSAARTSLGGWTLALLSGDRDVTRALGFKASRKYPVRLGPIDARLLIYPVAPRS